MKTLFLLLVLLLPVSVQAQTVRADRFVLSTGPCTLRSGSGSPEGVVVGRVCDTFWRTDTGTIYTKVSGTGNTGWSGSGVTGSGTANFIPKWVTPTALGDTELLISGKSVLPNLTYDINLGSLQKKFLTLHVAELWTETLVAQNTLTTIGGRVLVGPTNILVGDLSTSATSITVKYNNFANGDRVYMEANGQLEFFAITSSAGGSAGAYTYTVTRNLDGSGANLWSGGDAMFNTGTTGSGFIDIYSVRGIRAGTEVGPSIVGNVRNSTTYNDWSPRWAIGNLNGLYGYGVDVYGAAFGNPAAAWIKVDPTNGIRIGHSVTTKIQLDAATGNATFIGDITASGGTIGGWTIIAGYLYSGATSTARVGLHASDTATDVAIYAGDFNEGSAPFRVLHNGSLFASSATITGNITATSGNVAGALAANSITTTMLNADSVTSAKIAANTIVAADIATGTITADRLSVGSLSAITADLGSVTAGQIVVGGSNRLWLNDSGDGMLAIGGSTKSTATFRVPADGSVIAGNANFNGVSIFSGGAASVSFNAAFSITSFAGGGNQTLCVNNSGYLYTVASGATC